jgi:hypothetical protein
LRSFIKLNAFLKPQTSNSKLIEYQYIEHTWNNRAIMNPVDQKDGGENVVSAQLSAANAELLQFMQLQQKRSDDAKAADEKRIAEVKAVEATVRALESKVQTLTVENANLTTNSQEVRAINTRQEHKIDRYEQQIAHLRTKLDKLKNVEKLLAVANQKLRSRPQNWVQALEKEINEKTDMDMQSVIQFVGQVQKNMRVYVEFCKKHPNERPVDTFSSMSLNKYRPRQPKPAPRRKLPRGLRAAQKRRRVMDDVEDGEDDVLALRSNPIMRPPPVIPVNLAPLASNKRARVN